MVVDPKADRIRRVRALLAKASSTDSDDEREALEAKAMEIMAAHGIEQAQLSASRATRDKVILRHLDRFDRYERERSALLAAVGTSMRVVVVRQEFGVNAAGYSLLGFSSDIDRAMVLFQYLDAHAMMQVARLINASATASYRSNWLVGFALAISQRLQQAEERAADDALATEPGTALILADRSQQVEREARRIFPRVETHALTAEVGEASSRGWREGHRVDLGGGRVDTAARRAVGQ